MTVTVGWICATANWRGFYFGMQILDTLFPDLKNYSFYIQSKN